MSLAIFYDTETTGFPLWKESADDHSQPGIVQLAACLVDLETRKTLASMDVIIDVKRTIGTAACEVHGIDNARAQALGVNARTAIALFTQLWKKASVRIAHNQRFDEMMIRVELARHAGMNTPIYNEWMDSPAICTMQLANPLTAAEGSIGSKWPKLTEACKILMNRDVEDAHSAMPDVLACMDLYFHCIDTLAESA